MTEKQIAFMNSVVAPGYPSPHAHQPQNVWACEEQHLTVEERNNVEAPMSWMKYVSDEKCM